MLERSLIFDNDAKVTYLIKDKEFSMYEYINNPIGYKQELENTFETLPK